MIRKRLPNLSLAIFASLCALLSAQPALACSACYGDPNSAMSQGVQAGLFVLMGVVVMVLAGMASVVVFWMRRAAKLERQGGAAEEPRGAYATAAGHGRSGP